MPRAPFLCLLVLLLGTACGGPVRLPAVAPEPKSAPPAEPADAVVIAPPPPVPDLDLLPPAPALDTLVPASELAAEIRLAADSAADEAVLEALDEASPAGEETEDSPAEIESAAGTGGAKALAGPASWDIDVATYNNHDRVQYYLDLYRRKARERFGIWLSRMPRYESMIRERLQRVGLPGDLVYLALIESGFSNTATSRARAVGMWQYMKGTAKLYGLRVDSWVDERRDPYRATDAAVRHLNDLSHRFGSLYLAAAAYNAGSGKVSRSLVRLPEDDADSVNSDATFFRLYDTKLLRRETKDYVPKLIAAALIAKEPARYGFEVAPVELAAYDSIVVPGMTGLDVIARLADTTVAAIRELNPQFLRLATPPGVTAVVRIPAGRGPATEAAYAVLPVERRVTFVEHSVSRGETLGGIAHRYRVSLRLLTAANPRLRGRLRIGQRVIVPTGGAVSGRVAQRIADPVVPAGASPSGFHRVRRGENLIGLAEEYGVTVRDLREWNSIDEAGRIRAGQRLRVAPPKQARHAVGGGGRVHVVQRGETLKGLAKRYRVSVQALRKANALTSDATLKPGATLKIPG
jgi:membrane-bound lytic murein transglycosylase D